MGGHRTLFPPGNVVISWRVRQRECADMRDIVQAENDAERRIGETLRP